MKRTGIGILGAGAISGIYLENLCRLFTETEVVGVYDLVEEKVKEAQEKYGFRKAYKSMEELLADSEVDIVLNLTRPFEHYETTKAALLAGKHVYSEKPLAAVFEEGAELAALAAEKGLMLGGAPDTFLGAGIQTCRKLIDDGFIGQPVGAAAFMMCRGHESWHPSPEFYYQHGGGPMMDMGPYYLTALVNLLGGVSGVTGITRKSFPQRVITSEPKKGALINVGFQRTSLVYLTSTMEPWEPLQLHLTSIMSISPAWRSMVHPAPSMFPTPTILTAPSIC